MLDSKTDILFRRLLKKWPGIDPLTPKGNMVLKVMEQDCPHLLVYGPPCCGKKTLIMALLREIFGPTADKVKVENKGWKVDIGCEDCSCSCRENKFASKCRVELLNILLVIWSIN